MANTAGTKRLIKEFKALQADADPMFRAAYTEKDVRTWYFIIRGAPDTVYEEGFYMGKLIFPLKYPFGPPRVQMITPSDRFRVNQDLCLSISSFHPESWNPAWGVRSVIVGLQSFMSDVADPATAGGITARRECCTPARMKERRLKLAQKSKAFNKKHKAYQKYFMGFMVTPMENKKQDEEKTEKPTKRAPKATSSTKRTRVVDLTEDAPPTKKKHSQKKPS